MMPAMIPRPAARRARRFVRSSCLTVRLCQPEARSSPRVAGRAAEGTVMWLQTPGTGHARPGGERTTGPPDRQTWVPSGSEARDRLETGRVGRLRRLLQAELDVVDAFRGPGSEAVRDRAD